MQPVHLKAYFVYLNFLIYFFVLPIIEIDRQSIKKIDTSSQVYIVNRVITYNNWKSSSLLKRRVQLSTNMNLCQTKQLTPCTRVMFWGSFIFYNGLVGTDKERPDVGRTCTRLRSGITLNI